VCTVQPVSYKHSNCIRAVEKYLNCLVLHTVVMSESDISTSVKNGILFLEDPFDQVCRTVAVYYCFKLLFHIVLFIVSGRAILLW